MATQKRKTNSSGRSSNKNTKRNTGRNNATSRNKRNLVEDEFNEELVNEIILIGVIAIAILLFLCNFGILGTIGNVVSNVMFGLFGIPAYIFPIVATYIIFFTVANSGNPKVIRRDLSLSVLILNIAMIFELIQNNLSYGYNQTDFKNGVDEIWSLAYEKHKGGGFFAGICANISVKYLGMVGTIFLILVISVICIVLITEKSFLNGIRGASNRSIRAIEKGAENVRNNQERMNDLREERKSEALRRREEIRRKQEADRNLREEERRLKEEEKNRIKEEKRIKQEALENDRILKRTEFSGTPTYTFVKEEDIIKERDDLHEINLNDIENRVDIPDNRIRIHGIENKSETFNDSDNLNEIYFEGNNIFAGNSVVNHIEKTPEIIENLSDIDDYKDSFISDNDSAFNISSDVQNDNNEYVNSYEDFEESQNTYDSDDLNEIRFDKVEDTQIKNNSGSIFRDNNSAPTNGGRTFGTVSGTASDIKEPTKPQKTPKPYKYPPINLLKEGDRSKGGDKNELMQTANKLEEVLANFNVEAKISDVSQGPAVTRYEMIPKPGVKVSKILSLSDDIKLNLAAADIRIEAPIPGKAAIGIEVPNKESSMVALRDLIDSKEFKASESKLSFAVGKDLTGKVVVTDIAKMPHMLIAGSTGSGKSVCINTLIMSILYKAKPTEVKLIMIDPKVVELSIYNGIPHLLIPVVTDPRKANASLAWAVKEMDNRYQKFAEYGVRDLKGYNQKIENEKDINGNPIPKMFQLVVIVDELADLMMVAGKEVEESICRLAQLARAAGIHLIIATQRPSVDVITGLIKANMPSRISFAVSSGVDSRTILDTVGAEKLLGKGDMLFYPQGYTKPSRVQGAFVSDNEVSAVVDFLKNNGANEESINEDIVKQISNMSVANSTSASSNSGGNDDEQDEFFYEAGRLITESKKCSIGMLQRKYKIGFNRAARIMDALSEAGVVGPDEGTKPRAILMTPEQFEDYINNL